MTNGVSAVHSDVAVASILEDARFVVRTSLALVRHAETHGSVVGMAMLPAFGIITHESRKWVTQHRPDVAATLPDEEIDLVADIRNASKWFDASKDGQAGAISRFNALTVAHENEFLGNTPFAWARRFECDLGLYTHHGVDILNTHLVGTLLGIDALDRGPVVQRMAATMSGQAIALAGNRDDGASFIDALSPLRRRDVRSEKYYGKAGLARPESGYLHILWSALAFLTLLRPAVPDDSGTTFKLQFLGLYHAARTARRLDSTLAPVWPLTDGDAARQLRNDLIHYTPNHAHPAAALDASRPRHALVEHAFGRPFKDVADDVSTAVSTLHAELGRRLGH